MSDPGYCSVLGNAFAWSRGEKKTNPAEELNKLGLAAIPELIAHLDDTRPTRCQADGRRFAPASFYLLKYGDCCQQIFESITGHSIYKSVDGKLYPTEANKGAECKAEADRWWRDYQRKGEKQMFIEGTQTGDPDSAENALRLIAKYPEAALQPITQGVRRSKQAWVRESLLYAIDNLKGDDVLLLLREETAGPFRLSRVAACRGLLSRSHDEGVRATIKEWERPSGKIDDRWDESRGAENLILGLLQSREPAAIRALSTNFQQWELEVRAKIVELLGKSDNDSHHPPLTPEVEAVIGSLLARAIDDLERESSESSGPGGKKVVDPAIGDLAAEVLAARLGQPQLFDLYGHWGDRARQRLAVENAWLTKTGGKLLPVPEPRKIVAAPAAKVEPLLASVRNATTPAARQPALAGLEALGLPALPAIRKELTTMKVDHPALSDLQRLAARVALTVAEVRFDNDTLKPSKELHEGAAALRSKPINEVALMNFLKWSIRRLPAGARGIELSLERPNDDSGADLHILLVLKQANSAG